MLERQRFVYVVRRAKPMQGWCNARLELVSPDQGGDRPIARRVELLAAVRRASTVALRFAHALALLRRRIVRQDLTDARTKTKGSARGGSARGKCRSQWRRRTSGAGEQARRRSWQRALAKSPRPICNSADVRRPLGSRPSRLVWLQRTLLSSSISTKLGTGNIAISREAAG
jgi:hypothetical protein